MKEAYGQVTFGNVLACVLKESVETTFVVLLWLKKTDL